MAERAAAASGRIGFAWIADRRTDLTWYIGSALAGWLYIALIVSFGARLRDPLTDPIFTLSLGSWELPVSLTMIVVWSWAYLLDGPHLWATLGRTALDPDEWEVRGREIRLSFLWFALGPVLIFFPYVIAALGGPSSRGFLNSGYNVFFTFFKLWAYYHVVRQHWGFFRLYQRKCGESGGAGERIDWWFFNLSLYLPLLLFLSAPWYERTPGYFPNFGLHTSLGSGWTLAEFVHPAALALYALSVAGYVVAQIARYRRAEPLSGSKLLFLFSIVPLHLAVFTSPLLAAFVIPLVTVGHNLQYHRIVWDYGREKYFGGRGEAQKKKRYSWARRAFAGWAAYALFGLAFTFVFFRGPWILWLQQTLGAAIDAGPVSGALRAAGAEQAIYGVGESVFAAFILGWSMQHYYLDAKIWRVSRDAEVRRHLKID